MNKKDISVGILAGGRSSRMGRNKALIKLNNESMINTLIRELSGFKEVVISGNKRGIYEDMGCAVLYDENKDIGPIEGIRQVIRYASSDYVFICACDMPFISSELVEYIAGYISSDYDCYVIRTEDHLEPLCAIYHKSVLPVIEELIAEKKYRLREILERVRTRYISLEHTDFDKKTVKNINTKEDLYEISRPFVFCVSGYSGSGKTWLITRLINGFIKEGLKVSVLKHDGCNKFCDKAGSDTDLYDKAGATSFAIFSDERFSVCTPEKKTVDEMIDILKKTGPPPDYIIIEGMKGADIPTVERVGKDGKHLPERNSIICTVTDEKSPAKAENPVFDSGDIKGIFDFIRNYFEGI